MPVSTPLPLLLLSVLLAHPALAQSNSPGLPMVINTWGGPFTAATDAAYTLLTTNTSTPLDAVEVGGSTCERNQCDGSVGYGGSPDEACETTLDAMIMNGDTFNTGAVAGLRRIKNVIGVARKVLDNTKHSLLAGDLATQFAVEMGFTEESLATDATRARCEAWKAGGCQPNNRLLVTPNPATSCGPYSPLQGVVQQRTLAARSAEDGLAGRGHDTISMIAISPSGSMAAGTSTNGATHKVPGRVGDGPIVGSGSYVDSAVGGCGATGDGDQMLRMLPCYQAVENMRNGMTPTEAARDAVKRMVRRFPAMYSGIVVVNNKGEHGAAGSGWTFTYAYRGGAMNASVVVSVPPVCVPRVAARGKAEL